MDSDNNHGVELHEIRIDDGNRAPVNGQVQDEEDWRFLTQEDVRDLQTMFDYFVQQDPAGVKRKVVKSSSANNELSSSQPYNSDSNLGIHSERKNDDVSIYVNSKMGGLGADSLDSEKAFSNWLAGTDSLSTNRPGSERENDRDRGGNHAEPNGDGNSSHGQGKGKGDELVTVERLITPKGLSKLFESLGLFIPQSTVRTFMAERKSALNRGVDGFGALVEGVPPTGGDYDDDDDDDDEYDMDGLGSLGGGKGGESNHEGISYEDFLMMYAVCTKGLSTEQEMKEAFRFLDDDFDGYVDVSKLVPVLRKLLGLDTSQIHELLMQSYDARTASKKNTDDTGRGFTPEEWIDKGTMSYAEFKNFLMS